MPQKQQPFELKPAQQIIGLLYVQESNFIIILCLLLTDLKGSSKDSETAISLPANFFVNMLAHKQQKQDAQKSALDW